MEKEAMVGMALMLDMVEMAEGAALLAMLEGSLAMVADKMMSTEAEKRNRILRPLHSSDPLAS